jgi:hypothetical protein
MSKQLNVYHGDSLGFWATVTRSGGIVNLTGLKSAVCSIAMDKSAAPVLQLTLTAGVTNPAPTAGRLRVELTPEQTAALTEGGNYVWSLRIVEADDWKSSVGGSLRVLAIV